MGISSILHQGVQIPIKFDQGLLGLCSLPPVRLTQRHGSSPVKLYSARRVLLPVFHARSAEKEDFSASEDSKGWTTPQSSDDNKRVGSAPHNSLPSVSDANKTTEELASDYLSSVKTVAFWVSAAAIFGIGVGMKEGMGKASEFFAGYLLEQSLSVDNLFVFVLIFKYFQVPVGYQNRVLSYGIAGAIFFRAFMILLGTATLQRFEAVNLLMASILLYSSYKLFARDEEDSELSNNFVVKTCQKFIPVTAEYDGDKFITLQDGARKATPLLLTLAIVELSDIAFAVDSIPAVFGVTRDPFIVFSSNIFAILGLRSLYTLINGSMSELEYLQPSIGVVLGFIGCKMILDFAGYHVSTEASLGFVATTLGAGVLLSLMRKSD
ncbi:thylakoid membrane protein TERC, chloroplastic-like [Aristolochia californica]|uniref:thylakoid membrane protein TERC, chloroplastic-like n=1 Tax=Aristolochia californica TaxID=171875 RepID=UPI0035D7B872